MEQVASPAFESEKESEKDSGQDREPRVAAAPWWAALDERAAALLAAKCHGTATVELRDEAAEPHSFDMGTFVFIFLENLLMPLSIMPRFCSGRGRRGLVGKSYLPATKAFSADDELLWSLKLTRSGFGASKVHSLFFGNAWPSTVGLVYCGIRWWDDATTRYFFLLNCLLQFMLRAQWAMKYAYRRKAAEQRLQNGTSLDRRAEELLFGFIPLAPWLSIVELRLAALAERMDLSQELVFRGGAADAEAMFPPHAMRWLPDAVCRPGGPDQAGANSDHTGWAAGRPKVDAERGEFSVTAARRVQGARAREQGGSDRRAAANQGGVLVSRGRAGPLDHALPLCAGCSAVSRRCDRGGRPGYPTAEHSHARPGRALLRLRPTGRAWLPERCLRQHTPPHAPARAHGRAAVRGAQYGW